MGRVKITPALRALLAPLLLAGAVWLLLTAVGNMRSGSGDEGLRRLDAAVRRGAVTCYANEGVYPPSLEYLKKYYGLQVDESRYTVYYDIFAENLMPDVTVLENGEQP